MSDRPAQPHAFNGLSPAQAEVLALLSEECGEVIQEVGKILRHGLFSAHPDNPLVLNWQRLARELGQVQAVVMLLKHEQVLLSESEMTTAVAAKLGKLPKTLHHAVVPAAILRRARLMVEPDA
jgi:hypothetical protein